MPSEKRRLWKTFFVTDHGDFRSLQSAWGSWKHNSRHRMTFDRGVIETNLPLAELRSLFRSANVTWIDYVSDTEQSKDD